MYPYYNTPTQPPLYSTTYTPHPFLPHLPSPSSSLTPPPFTHHTFPHTIPQTPPLNEATPTDPTLSATPTGLDQRMYPVLPPPYYNSPSHMSHSTIDTSLPFAGEDPSLLRQLAMGSSDVVSGANNMARSVNSRRNLSGSFGGEAPGLLGQLNDGYSPQQSVIVSPPQLQVLGSKRRLDVSHVSLATNSVPSAAGSSGASETTQGPQVKIPRWDQYMCPRRPVGNSFQYLHVPTLHHRPHSHSSSHMTPYLISRPHNYGNNPVIEGLRYQEHSHTESNTNDNQLPVATSDRHGDSSNRVSVSLRFPVASRHETSSRSQHPPGGHEMSLRSQQPPGGHEMSLRSQQPPGGHEMSLRSQQPPGGHEMSLRSQQPPGGHEMSLRSQQPPGGHEMSSRSQHPPGGHEMSSRSQLTPGGHEMSLRSQHPPSGHDGASFHQYSQSPIPDLTSTTNSNSTGTARVSNVQFHPANALATPPTNNCTQLSMAGHSSLSSLAGASVESTAYSAGVGNSFLNNGGERESEGDRDSTLPLSNDARLVSCVSSSMSHDPLSMSHDSHMSHDHRAVVPALSQSETDGSSEGDFQLVPTQSGGRGFSLSVEISGSGRGNTIGLNLDVSEIENSSGASGSRSSAVTVPPTPTSPLTIPSPSPPSTPYIHISSQAQPGTSGLSGLRSQERDEVIIVDSSDDDDDHTVIMFTSHRTPQRHSPAIRYGNGVRGRHRQSVQISQDERLARHLQAQFDQELDISVQTTSNPTFPPHITPIVTHTLHPPPFPPSPSGGRGSTSTESNLWSSRGPSGAVPPLPYVPSLDNPSPTPDPTSNYHALASHIHHITPTDAHRILRAASLSGRSSVIPARRRRRLLANSSIIFNSFFARHSSYEELLELAERLGPAHSRGLTKEEINRLPSRAHRKSDGDDKSCVVCMSDFQSREKIRSLRPCSHDFHQKCIDKWLKEHNTCPICRVTVSSRPSSS